jgi:hypothetical protein
VNQFYFLDFFFQSYPSINSLIRKKKGLKLQYGKNTKIKDRGLTCKTQRKYMTNHVIATIFILVQNFVLYIFYSLSQREKSETRLKIMKIEKVVVGLLLGEENRCS